MSKGAIFMINDTLINSGGIFYSYKSYKDIKILYYKSLEYIDLDHLPDYSYNAASVYYKNKIYIHGGGSSFGSLPLYKLVKNDLIVINLNEKCENSDDLCVHECSKGTYSENEECYLCPKGSYSDTLGSDSCKPCKAGYFSGIIGADTPEVCTPCPYGYYSSQEGQSKCLECQLGSVCTLNEIRSENDVDIDSFSSIQPELLGYKTEIVSEKSKYFYIGVSIVLVVSLVLLLNFEKTQICLRQIDIYSLKHNYDLDQPMYIRNTLIGGIFTISFIFAALAIVFNMFLSYSIDNIRETKALVPLAALEQQYDSVITI
jgi:hypothetical protein